MRGHRVAGVPHVQTVPLQQRGLRARQALPVHNAQPSITQQKIESQGVIAVRVGVIAGRQGGRYGFSRSRSRILFRHDVGGRGNDRNRPEQLGHMSGQFVAAAPMADRQRLGPDRGAA